MENPENIILAKEQNQLEQINSENKEATDTAVLENVSPEKEQNKKPEVDDSTQEKLLMEEKDNKFEAIENKECQEKLPEKTSVNEQMGNDNACIDEKPKEEVSANEQNNDAKADENKSQEALFAEKEKYYIEMVFALESEKQTIIDETKTKISQLRKEFEELVSENERLKRKNAQLEHNLVQKEASNGSSDTKSEQYDILTKAKTLLFEKTKICKQQEQHIEMLKTQVDSIKEVLAITKDMLNLRNTENEHLQSRLDAIELRFKTEKDRQTLLEKKLVLSKQMYDKLRKEHDYQTNLYKELKSVYDQKIKVLETQLKQAKSKE